MHRQGRRMPWAVMAAMFVAPAAWADEPSAVRESGVAGGLCVVLPAIDGAALAEHSCDGRFVVHGLAPSEKVDAVRRAIPPRLAGLVSAQAWTPSGKLFYADNLVDLLVVDRDALEVGPDDAELLRCVTPSVGAVWRRKGGKWEKLVKPMPADYGEWSHFYCDATNNPVSKDRAVRVPTGLHWIAESPARIGAQNQLVGKGRYVGVFSEAQKTWFSTRNAFNGIQSWRTEPRDDKAIDRRFGPVVLSDGMIYAAEPGKAFTVVARDLLTGSIVKKYDLPLPINDKPVDIKTRRGGRYLGLAACEDVLVAWAKDQLVCVERATGKVRWSFDGRGKNVDFPTYDPINHRLGLLIAGDNATFLFGDRDTSFRTAEVASLSLRDGAVAWRVPYPLAPEVPECVAFLWSEGSFFFNSNVNLGVASFSVGAMDAATGKTRWLKKQVTEWAGAKGNAGIGVGSLLVYPEALVLTRSALVAYKPRDGATIGEWAIGNSRCDAGRGDANGFANFGHYFRLDGEDITAVRNEVSRNNCGGANLPVYGMHYYTPQTCYCFAAVRGLLALSSQPIGPERPDAQRLVHGPAYGLKPTLTAGAGDWPALLHDSARSAAGAPLTNAVPKERWRIRLETGEQPGPAAADWRVCANNNGPISAPVIAGGLVIVAAPDAHRIHAVDAATGAKRWSFITDARVDTPPTIAGGRIYAGCRDGWVYCLDLASGELVWRFLAARNHKRIVAYDQVESAWPLHGALVVEKNQVVANAGYHPDIDGGIYCWGLDADTGAVRWKRAITSERTQVQLDPKSHRLGPDYFAPNKTLNSLASSDGVVVNIPGVILSLADGSGKARVGGKAPLRPLGKPFQQEPISHGLMVTDWHLCPPYLRSRDGNFDGPGSPTQKMSYFVSGAEPARVTGWARRAAWDAKRYLHLAAGPLDLMVLDRSEPIELSWGTVERDKAVVGEVTSRCGKTLAHIPLDGGALKKGAGCDPSAMILAGNHAYISWSTDGKGDPRRLYNRAATTLQIIDLPAARLVAEFPVRAGIIEHGLATAQGRLYASLDDGTLIAFE